MLRTRKVRPSLEALEDRCTPSASVAVSGGDLLVTGTAAKVSIQAGQTGFMTVTADGVTKVITGVTHDIRVNLTNNTGSIVTIDLGNTVAARAMQNVVVNTGGGADTVTIRNGLVKSGVSIATGGGDDKIFLGGTASTTKLTVNGSVSIDAGGGAGDAVTIRKGTTISSNLECDSGNTLVLEQGAVVKQDALIFGSAGGNNVTIAGSVGNDLWFFGSSRVGATDTFTLAKTGSVGHNLTAYTDGVPSSDLSPLALAFYGLLPPAGNQDTVILDGAVGHDVLLDTGAGNDAVTFGADLTIKGSAQAYLGLGDDTFNYNTPKTRPIVAFIDGGLDDNTLNGKNKLPDTVTPVRFKTVNP